MCGTVVCSGMGCAALRFALRCSAALRFAQVRGVPCVTSEAAMQPRPMTSLLCAQPMCAVAMQSRPVTNFCVSNLRAQLQCSPGL